MLFVRQGATVFLRGGPETGSPIKLERGARVPGFDVKVPVLFAPRRYHTQSPHRPLLIAGSRHRPEGVRNGQARHPGLRSTARRRTAFGPLESPPAGAFNIRHSSLRTGSVGTLMHRREPFGPKPAGQRFYFTRRAFGVQWSFALTAWPPMPVTAAPGDDGPGAAFRSSLVQRAEHLGRRLFERRKLRVV